MPCLSRLCLKLKGNQGSGPEGVDDLCFNTYGEFYPSPPPSILEAEILASAETGASKLGSGPLG